MVVRRANDEIREGSSLTPGNAAAPEHNRAWPIA